MPGGQRGEVCVAGGAYGWNGCCRPGKVKLLVGMMKSEQRMWSEALLGSCWEAKEPAG